MLEEFEYTYKDELANNYYIYQCSHRYDFKAVVKIRLDELINYNENNKNTIVNNYLPKYLKEKQNYK